jgi:NADPH-dependent 2,4-dienoyl-CoA reductase/sulfur reductase-like enzyme
MTESGKISLLAKVVIVGAGFAGLSAARELVNTNAEVTVIDRRNYHLFQPLLYQVATAALSPADIAWPIRGLLARQRNARVVMGRVAGIDVEHRKVITENGQRYPYDYLVLATGARHAYFGRDDWAEVAPGLKKIDDATDIRRRVLLAFEHAEQTNSPEERRQLMTSKWRAPLPNWPGIRWRAIFAKSIRARHACCWSRPGRAFWLPLTKACPSGRRRRWSILASRSVSARG